MVGVRRIIFFIVSSVIIALLIKWGFDGFEVITKIYPSTELIDERTGNVLTQTEGSFKLGLDLVIVISIGLSALGFVVLNFFKAWFAARED